MTKNDLINAILESGKIKTKSEARTAIDEVFKGVVKTLMPTNKKDKKAETSLTIVNFGTFRSPWRKQKKGINPNTQEEIIIPAHRNISFRASKSLKERLN